MLSEEAGEACETRSTTRRVTTMILGPKTTILIHLAAAMARGCYP